MEKKETRNKVRIQEQKVHKERDKKEDMKNTVFPNSVGT